MKPSVLLVDKDRELLESTLRVLRKELQGECRFEVVCSQSSAIRAIRQLQPHVVVLDLLLSPERGEKPELLVLEEAKRLDATSTVIILTSQGNNDNEIQVMRKGASSFLEKPVDSLHLSALIRDGIRRTSIKRSYQETNREKTERSLERTLIGESVTVRHLREDLKRIAEFSHSVLITGETGTGKTTFAKLLHSLSERRDAPFIIPDDRFTNEDLAKSEFFGHVKGAFTGAEKDKQGLIARANGGTLFIDEVDCLPLGVQKMLLRVLEEGIYRPLGGERELHSDFRLITASNGELEKLIRMGEFREDLYYRISTESIHIPPLRERREDIAPISNELLQRLCAANDFGEMHLSKGAQDLLTVHSLPGNVRDIRNALQRGLSRAYAEGRAEITGADLRIEVSSPIPHSGTLEALTLEFKREIILTRIQSCSGNRSQAARSLGISARHLRRLTA